MTNTQQALADRLSLAEKIEDGKVAAMGVLSSTEYWSGQWENYRATTEEAIELLHSLGYEIAGEGQSTGIEAVVGFYKDDRGYRSSNLDYAKSYSGYQPELSPITVITPRSERIAKEKKERAERIIAEQEAESAKRDAEKKQKEEEAIVRINEAVAHTGIEVKYVYSFFGTEVDLGYGIKSVSVLDDEAVELAVAHCEKRKKDQEESNARRIAIEERNSAILEAAKKNKKTAIIKKIISGISFRNKFRNKINDERQFAVLEKALNIPTVTLEEAIRGAQIGHGRDYDIMRRIEALTV